MAAAAGLDPAVAVALEEVLAATKPPTGTSVRPQSSAPAGQQAGAATEKGSGQPTGPAPAGGATVEEVPDANMEEEKHPTGLLALANTSAEDDEKWTTELVFEVLAYAGFSGTLKDARA
jgi:hypothetical protein